MRPRDRIACDELAQPWARNHNTFARPTVPRPASSRVYGFAAVC
jgi:hypothetical protein